MRKYYLEKKSIIKKIKKFSKKGLTDIKTYDIILNCKPTEAVIQSLSGRYYTNHKPKEKERGKNMLKEEFIERTNYIPTTEEYAKIEENYYNFNGDKDAFCADFVKNLSAYQKLLRDYETSVIIKSDKYTDNLQSLAAACTFSVFNKIIDVSNNPIIENLKRCLYQDLKQNSRIANLSQIASTYYFDKNGNMKYKVLDGDADKSLTKICKQSFSDAMDIYQDCVLKIIEETQKGDISIGFMTQSYNIRKLDKRVHIKKIDSNAFKTVETMPILEVYKHIRQKIADSRTVKAASGVYTYLSELVQDTESDVEDIIYLRFGKYADMGGYVRDANGKDTFYTADETTAEEIQNLIEKMGLTTPQQQIIEKRLEGYGQRAIGTYYGITPQAVQSRLKSIQAAAKSIGLTPKK